ncbi:hypothetical protein CDAR_416531 [Caerostris darwini]|uniref:Uncharacterized protein n=1 Tax=Caerostris darwini TaxID=1538125 RepID=A0AAV4MIS2_9ARAC|nr:hypothetical protein CDAR_416531 [Caerostris darwini]
MAMVRLQRIKKKTQALLKRNPIAVIAPHLNRFWWKNSTNNLANKNRFYTMTTGLSVHAYGIDEQAISTFIIPMVNENFLGGAAKGGDERESVVRERKM